MTTAQEDFQVKAEGPAVRTWLFAASVIVVGSVARIGQLRHALDEMHGFRQSQTSFVVREYAEHGINLLHTPLPVFGPGSDVPMELPLAQAVAAVVTRLGLSAEAATRLVGLAGFEATALLLFVLVGRWHGHRAAAIALVLFESLPLGLAWGASALIEFPATACALAMVLALDRWFEKGDARWLGAGGVAAWLAFLIKSTTAPPWVILAIGSALFRIRSGVPGAMRRAVIGGVVGPVLGLACAVGWAHYADSIKADQPLTGFLTSSSLAEWNFGTLAQRLGLGNTGIILTRMAAEEAAVVAAVGLLLCLVWPRADQPRILGLAWAGVVVSAPAVFFNLYFVHNYYLSATYPAIVALAGLGIDRVFDVVKLRLPAMATAAAVTVAVVAYSMTTQLGHADVQQWRTSPAPNAAAVALDSMTPKRATIVMIGCDWNPLFAYDAHRSALMFRDANDDGYWEKERNLASFHYLFTCDPDLDPRAYLPECAQLRRTHIGLLWKIDEPVTPCP